MLTHAERSWECNLCNQIFTTYNDLKAHESVHYDLQQTPINENHLNNNSSCLDLTKPKENETTTTTTPKKKALGFTIEEIMRR